VYQADLPINSGYAQFAAAAAALEPVDSSRWAVWTASARAEWEENLRHQPMPGDVDLGEVMAFLRERLPDDAILTNGAGNFSVWAHRFYRFTRYRTQLGPTSGAMGYGLPAAVAAKLVHPERIVVCFTGDGDFLMTGQELATAVQYELPVVVLLVNNRMYGTIRMHQERHYPGRVVGTDLVNPDFAALAAAFGAHGETVDATADFEPAFERALESRRPALVELRVDPEAITPRATLSQLRAAAERGA
jgi:acetolactate synthase-1/2/3 large subunit